MNVLITGANRGIGAEFVRHYLAEGHHVWGCYRHDKGELGGIHSESLHLLRWDVALDLEPEGELPKSIDLLVNNAGIYGSSKGGQSLDSVIPEAMLEVFNVDCVGPLRVVKYLKDCFSKTATIANLSSKMGSSADNTSGGTYAYRAAKAALVIVSKSMAVDLSSDGIQVITLHPGWVQTDMTNHTGLIDVETSVQGMTKVIAQARDYEPGQFIAFDGKVVPY
jgi:NAD(P)-dependent dehydrogenase (short-subunit alcohol dehydrogenase family)